MLPFFRCRKTVFLAGMVVLLLAVLPPSVVAQDLTNPLTAAEVACNEAQLERLLTRMSAGKEVYVTPQLPSILLVSYSNSAGFYDGLVATTQEFRVGPGEIPPILAHEHYLSFNINPSIRTLLLNPERPELAQVSLNREQSSSSLVTPGGYFDLTLTLDPTLEGGDSLTLNNFEEPAEGWPYNGFLANSTKPGRGLIADGLLSSCHDKFTPFDRHVVSVLQRMIRAEAMNQFFDPDVKVAIFRGQDPHTYRFNVYPIFEHFEAGGRMAIELRFSWTAQGRLTTAEMIPLAACTAAGELGCSALTSSPIVGLIPPVFGGKELYNNGAVSDRVFFEWTQGPSGPVTVDFEKLLAKTAWNEPVW